jgi:hypothetical protein
MAATKRDVDRWILQGKKHNFAFIISVCDTFDHDDYPVYVTYGEDLEKRKSKYDGVNMQRINEIIDLSKYNKKGELIK